MIAGAGSGKTTLMAARVVYLVVTGQVRPEEVLGLTFTTKAAAELRNRIRAALRAAGRSSAARSRARTARTSLEPTVATYNAYAADLLTDHGLRIGHEPDTRVITDASRYQLGARAIDRFTGEVELLTDHPATVIQNLLALDSAMSEHLVDADDVRARRRRGPGRVRARARRGAGRQGPQDLPRAAREGDLRDRPAGRAARGWSRPTAAQGRPRADGLLRPDRAGAPGSPSEQPEVGALERARFKVVLLDEYQDTSVAQATMLSRLFSGPDARRGHPVTAVGDPNQAIYGWRGASVSNILGFAETFPAADGEPVPAAR